MDKIPVDDTIMYALARLVDDAQKDRRDPSHSDIEFQIQHAGLQSADPNKSPGSPVGKAKRVRNVLSRALDSSPAKAETFASGILSAVRSCRGFSRDSDNYVGEDAVKGLADALRPHGFVLGADGTVSPVALERLSGKQLTEALRSYVARAKKGIEDGALVVGTGKDLIEAVAAHVLQELWGQHSTTANFPTLLGQAFDALGMVTPGHTPKQQEHARCRLERDLYETACAVNNLRNKQGTGHGRPWMPDLRPAEVTAVIELIGIVSELMLDKLEEKRT